MRNAIDSQAVALGWWPGDARCPMAAFLVAAGDPHGAAVTLARPVFARACAVCDWDPALAASAGSDPPPIR